MKKSVVYAGRGERFFAYLLDVLFSLVPVRLAAGFFIVTDPATNEPTIAPAFLMVMFLINLIYYTYFIASRWQATPGMRLLGIYVVRMDNKRLSPQNAAERFLAFTLPFLPVYVSFLPPQLTQMVTLGLIVYWFIPILYTDERMGLHDRLCRTRVLIGKVG